MSERRSRRESGVLPPAATYDEPESAKTQSRKASRAESGWANVDLERFIVGMLLTRNLQKDEAAKICSCLGASDFTDRYFRQIFEVASELVDKGIVINRMSVFERAKGKGYDHITLSLLATIDAEIPQQMVIDDHVLERLRNYKRMRELSLAIADTEAAMRDKRHEHDAGVYIQKLEETILRIRRDQGVLRMKSIGDIVDDCGGVGAFLDPDRFGKPIMTGIRSLDKVLGGFYPGQLVVVAARPSVGKTAFTVNIALNNAMLGIGVAIFSLEMTKEQIIYRIAAQLSKVSAKRFREGLVNAEQYERFRQGIEMARALPIYIDDTPKAKVSDIRNFIISTPFAVKVGMAIIDNLQIVDLRPYAKSAGPSTRERMTEMTGDLKRLAKSLGMPIVALSQLSREVTKREKGENKPKMSDMRESGSIEQDADIIVGLHRESMEKPNRADLREKAEALVLKARDGELAGVNIRYIPELTTFTDLDEEEDWRAE